MCPQGSPGCRIIVSTSAVGYWKVVPFVCSSVVIGLHPTQGQQEDNPQKVWKHGTSIALFLSSKD